jgi:hypothetical protein
LEGSQILQHPPWKRRVASWLFNRLVQGLFSLGTPDTQCGLKGFSQAAARRLFTMQTVHSFAFDVEILYWAHRWNFKISQVPVTLVLNDSSSVRFTRHTFGVLLDLWKIRWRTGPFRSRASRPDPRREEAL